MNIWWLLLLLRGFKHSPQPLTYRDQTPLFLRQVNDISWPPSLLRDRLQSVSTYLNPIPTMEN